MRIGIVTTWFERGGAYVSRQYMRVLEQQNEVFIYVRDGESYAKGDPKWDKPNVTWGKELLLPVSTAIDLTDFKNWIIHNKLDVVLFNEQQWWAPVKLCNKLEVITGAYIDYYTEETVPLFANYDFLICNTQRHYSVFKWHPQAIYIPWGTETDLFMPAKNFPEQARSDTLTFFHSCGMSPLRKGTDILIAAFAKVNGNVNLLVHSQVEIIKAMPQYENIINDMLVAGRLKITKDTVPAPGLYSRGDVYVYPARLDGIGLTMAEALSSGLPLIVPDNPPMNEFVTEQTGKVVTVEKLYSRADGYYWPQCEVNIDALAEAMQYYADNIRNIKEYKNNARNYALDKLNWLKNADILNSKLKEFRKIDLIGKKFAQQKLDEYEAKRAKIHMRIYKKYPKLYRILHSIWRMLKIIKR